MRNYATKTVQVGFKTFRLWEDGEIDNVQFHNYDHFQSEKWQGNLHASNGITATYYNAHRYYMGTAPLKRWSGKIKSIKDGRQTYYENHIIGRRHIVVPKMGQLDGNPTSLLFPAWTETAAITKALNKCSDHELALGQFVGELSASVVSATDILVKVVKAYKLVRKGQIDRALFELGLSRYNKRGKALVGRYNLASTPKKVADAWLAMKYGWLPLVEESFIIANGIQQKVNGHAPFKVKVAVTTDLQLTDPGPSFDIVIDKATKGTEVGLRYVVGDEQLAHLNSLGLINPLELTWELLPLSFVFDYFISLGDFLSAFSAPLGLEFGGGYVTRFAYGNFGITETTIEAQFPLGDDVLFKVDTFGMNRVPLVKWPKPGLWVKPLLGASQAASISALLAQQG